MYLKISLIYKIYSELKAQSLSTEIMKLVLIYDHAVK